ncbi:MAG: PQQ-binding-like beta-propeller repeat protein [Gemmatimonadales bacterium]|nr:PQQ-binding-like beta-propeller repeat protein [Gemmatimonadales bacterium]NIN12131.1 PQQ-binding-like beta-propeller repeat protein [Gemmatimonadales bacterium]NIN50569.1 PQQ-binding-like beta-propeller repeat protein [Gemmatimonadales bacterium]NIP08033.1 PQQ-binding-like beta-propeller repeat protein [Gemmatimonadales bacterium]NIR01000.1 PQQ-binding-like beta-propeller repeat protein [Gemmatimonadales bacterium]
MSTTRKCAAALLSGIILVGGCAPQPWWSDPDATWIRSYGGEDSDVGEGIVPADDGGLFIAGTADLQFGPEPRGDVYLVRTDSSGELVWEKTYGGAGIQAGRSIIRARDGGLVIAGESSSTGDGERDALLIKVDQGGNLIWSRTFEGPLQEAAVAVRQTGDGGYILLCDRVDPEDPVADAGRAGYGGYDARSSLYLIRTDGEGNLLWSRDYDSGANTLASSGILAPDGGFLILATVTHYPESNDDILLLKVDERGDEVWSRTWEEGRSYGYDLVGGSDGTYLIVGSYAPPDDVDRSEADHLFIKVDAEGNEVWHRSFGDSRMMDWGYGVTESRDGGYLVPGTRTKDLFRSPEDISLTRIDENGELLWQQIFPTATHNMFGGVVERPDGSIVVAGSTLMGDGTFDVFLIETDSEGNARW